MNNTDINILLYMNIISLIIGYLLGRSRTNGVTSNSPVSFFHKNKHQENSNSALHNDISINDKKVVVNIKTDGLEKKYVSLGEIKQTEENISNSINKLKNLKG